jgi:hypothetical protein
MAAQPASSKAGTTALAKLTPQGAGFGSSFGAGGASSSGAFDAPASAGIVAATVVCSSSGGLSFF